LLVYCLLSHFPWWDVRAHRYRCRLVIQPWEPRATDNRLTIDLDKEQLLKLVKSEYTLVHLKPGEMNVTIKSLTIAGPFRTFKKMKRTKRFEFEAGQTYYISVEPVDGEFRGTYFLPHLVDLTVAKEKSRFMRARGLAKKAPLHGPDNDPLLPFWPFI